VRIVELGKEVNVRKMENLPLWLWALIVGIIVSSKFIYRWIATKDLANAAGQSKYFFKRIRRNWTIGNPTRIIDHKYDPHKYSPSRYKDYLAMRKNNIQKLD
jgi:hypothetical protein